MCVKISFFKPMIWPNPILVFWLVNRSLNMSDTNSIFQVKIFQILVSIVPLQAPKHTFFRMRTVGRQIEKISFQF